MTTKTKHGTRWLCTTALLMAMNIIMSMSVFSVPVPGGHLYLNDVIICFAALILDPLGAFCVGGVGVKIEFSEDGPSLQDTLAAFLLRIKSGR